ncbi:MAG: glycosyl transferase group 1 [Cyanobacteria bacterium RYN_339]|nr:glycosyl transferase group 1 [Cyanobacteria bacterium RYN_339]
MLLRFERPSGRRPLGPNPVNVLVMTNHLNTGGAETFVVRLANELTVRGHHVVVLSAGGELMPKLRPDVARAVAPCRAKGPWGMLSVARTTRRLIEDHRIQVVHANSTNTAMSAWLARAGAAGPPIISSAHGVWEPWKKRGVARAFDLCSDRVVGCSEELTTDLLNHGLRQAKAQTIHNGIPLPTDTGAIFDRGALRRALGLPANRPLILGVGRLVEQKGFGTLIEALPRVLAVQPDVLVALAGVGELREALGARAEELGVSHAVRFLGRREDVPRLLAAADIFCLPSLDEGLPLAIAEAMAAGLPVVATPVGGVPEIVSHGETGWLVPPRMPAALALRLIALLADPGVAHAMGQAGRERVVEGFTLDRMTSRFEGLYHELLQTAPEGASQAASLRWSSSA